MGSNKCYITENGEQKISDTSSTTRGLNVGYSPFDLGEEFNTKHYSPAQLLSTSTKLEDTENKIDIRGMEFKCKSRTQVLTGEPPKQMILNINRQVHTSNYSGTSIEESSVTTPENRR